MRLDGGGHRGGGLAGADDDGAAARARRQMRRHAQRRRRGGDRRVEHGAQQGAMIAGHDAPLHAFLAPISWLAMISSARTIAE